MMLDQKVNSSNFLQFKMAHKAAETTHNINNAFGPGTAKQGTVVVQEVLQRKALKMRSIVVSHRKVTTTN